MTPRIRLGFATATLVLVCAACGSDSTGPRGDPLVITTTALSDAFEDRPYSAGINAEGGNEGYEWSLVSGSLPEGLTLATGDLGDDDLLITGTPEQETTAAFTIRVRSQDGQTATKQFTLTVLPPPERLIIETTVLPSALAGEPYEVRLEANRPETVALEWSVFEGTLPAGLSLTQAGVIQGTPTSSDTSLVTFAVDDGFDTAGKRLAVSVVANRTGSYDITTVDVAGTPSSIQPHVEAAVDIWEAVITGDLQARAMGPDFFPSGACGGFGEVVNGTATDDILVLVNIDSIDGPGGVLGQAGPCVLRNDNSLPYVGILTLDSFDLLPLTGTETLTLLLAHEIGHILGFGTLWADFGFVADTTDDFRYTGGAAVQEWHNLGGTGDVPLETGGGQGTARAHWRESTFDRELMTGFIEAVTIDMPLSRVTVGAFEDLGYAVDYGAADPYTLAAALRAPGAEREGDIGYDILYDGPVYVAGPDGRAVPLERGGRP